MRKRHNAFWLKRFCRLTYPSADELLIISCHFVVNESRRGNDAPSKGGSPTSFILLRNIFSLFGALVQLFAAIYLFSFNFDSFAIGKLCLWVSVDRFYHNTYITVAFTANVTQPKIRVNQYLFYVFQKKTKNWPKICNVHFSFCFCKFSEYSSNYLN